MKIRRAKATPNRGPLPWDDRWEAADHGLIAAWERGREKGREDPELAEKASAGCLVILPWKGGVQRAIKAKKKYGCLLYLAMWQGLRGDDLDIDMDDEIELRCASTGMTVIYTGDTSKYAAEE